MAIRKVNVKFSLNKFEFLLKLYGIKKIDLEKICSFGATTVRKWGSINPKIDQWKVIADYFNVSMEFFYEDSIYKNLISKKTFMNLMSGSEIDNLAELEIYHLKNEYGGKIFPTNELRYLVLDKIDSDLRNHMLINLLQRLSNLKEHELDRVHELNNRYQSNHINTRGNFYDQFKVMENHTHSNEFDSNYFSRIVDILDYKNQQIMKLDWNHNMPTWTISRLANESGVDYSSIRRWDTALPRPSSLFRIRKSLKVTLDELTYGRMKTSDEIASLATEIMKLSFKDINTILAYIKSC